MTVTSASLRLLGAERAVGILTAYCVALDSNDDEALGALFGILDGLVANIQHAVTVEERHNARSALTKTVLALASITAALLDDSADSRNIDRYDMLSGLARELYRSLT